MVVQRPDRSRSQNDSGVSTPPGKRQLIPTIPISLAEESFNTLRMAWIELLEGVDSTLLERILVR